MKIGWDELSEGMRAEIVEVNEQLNFTAIPGHMEEYRVAIHPGFETHVLSGPASPLPIRTAIFTKTRAVGVDRARWMFSHIE